MNTETDSNTTSAEPATDPDDNRRTVRWITIILSGFTALYSILQTVLLIIQYPPQITAQAPKSAISQQSSRPMTGFEFKHHLLALARKFARRIIDLSRGDPAYNSNEIANRVFSFFAEFGCNLRAGVAVNEAWSMTLALFAHDPLRIEKAQLVQQRLENCGQRLGIMPDTMWKDFSRQLVGQGYGAPTGEALARCVTADYLNDMLLSDTTHQFDQENVILCLGGGEAIGAFLQTCVASGYLYPGAKVVVMNPIYSPYLNEFRRIGCTIVGLECWNEEPTPPAWQRFEREAIGCKLIVIVEPNNPYDGLTLNPEVKERLAQFAARENALILADTVYMPLHPVTFKPMVAYAPERTILCHSLSKSEVATGLRFGALAFLPDAVHALCHAFMQQEAQTYETANAELVKLFVRSKSLLPNLSHVHFVPTSVQWQAIIKMLLTGSEFTEDYRQELMHRENAFRSEMQLPHVDAPHVPYYILIDLRDYLIDHDDDERFAKLLAKINDEAITPPSILEAFARSGVIVMRADDFWVDTKAHEWSVRISIANVTISNVREAAAIIVRVLQELAA